jgi:hypothetical protein
MDRSGAMVRAIDRIREDRNRRRQEAVEAFAPALPRI